MGVCGLVWVGRSQRSGESEWGREGGENLVRVGERKMSLCAETATAASTAHIANA